MQPVSQWKNVARPVERRARGWHRVGGYDRFHQAIRHLLMTPKATYLHDPDYGTILHQMRGQPVNEDWAETIAEEVARQVQQELPEIRVEDVIFQRQDLETEDRVEVIVVWSVPDLGRQPELRPPSDFGRQQTVISI